MTETTQAQRGDAAAPRAHEQVVSWVEEAILEGRLVVGDHLPSERELAARLGVSRAAVREGIRVLDSQGVLVSHVGAGRQGGTVVTPVSGRALTRLLRLHVALNQFPLDDVLEARVTLERSSARLAAQHARETDLERIVVPMQAMQRPDITQVEFNECDTAFHVAVAQASRNALVTDMTTAIRESMRLPILSAFRRVEDFEETIAPLRREHQEVATAIVEGRGNDAADAVERHIRRAYADLPMSEASQAAAEGEAGLVTRTIARG